MKRPTGQEEEWDWIERYWSGQLSAVDTAFFEQTMNEDPRFAQEVAALQHGVGIIKTIRMERHIRQTLEHLHVTDRRQRLINIRWVSLGSGLVAASIVLVLFSFFRPVNLPGYDNKWEVIRSLTNDYQTDTIDQFSLQRKRAFTLFFDAQALFSEGQPGPAAQRFEQVLTFTNLRPYFREAVEWHLVLCYLKTNQPGKARELYEQVRQKKVYDIGLIDRWQIGWQVWVANLL